MSLLSRLGFHNWHRFARRECPKGRDERYGLSGIYWDFVRLGSEIVLPT